MVDDESVARYYIDLDGAVIQNRSVSAMIAERRCYVCQQEDAGEPMQDTDPKGLIDRIAKQCSQTDDYLLPDTPLKEGIFRIILAGGNKPMTADNISEELTARWAMSTYPRDLSSGVISRVLEHAQSYCVAVISPPEPEPEPEDVEVQSGDQTAAEDEESAG